MTGARLFGLALVVVLVAAGVALLLRPAGRTGTAEGASAPVVGRRAPDFALQAASGGQVDLAALRGRVVVLDFWATWCIPCRSEMPALQRAYRANGGRLTVLAIDKQEPVGDVRGFAQRYGLSFPLLLDPQLTVWSRYRVTIQPVSFWVDRDGVIRSIHYGPMDDRTIQNELSQLTA